MPSTTEKGTSKYAAKRRVGGRLRSYLEQYNRPRFRCERCKGPLNGKRAHGFVTYDGKARICGHCAQNLGIVR